MPNILRFGGKSASGNAVASDLLIGKTATTEVGEITGSMVDRGAIAQTLPINGSFQIPQGYHNGDGVVSQNVSIKGGQTYTPGTANLTIPANQYLTGDQVILGDADLIPSNIKLGTNIFGVDGSLVQGITVFTNLTNSENVEIDTTAYLGGKLFCHTGVVSRTGGVTYGYCNKAIDGWNGSAWVTLCSSGVGGSGSDVWLTDEDTAIINNTVYTKIRLTGSSANNAGSARFGSVFGAK